MKKENFLQIVRSKAKAALTPEEEGMFSSIGEAIEQAFTLEQVERNKKITEIEKQLGDVEDGQTLNGIIRTLAQKVDEVEANAARGLSESDKYNLKRMLMEKESEIKACRTNGKSFSLEFKAKRAASAMMTNSTLVTGATAFNTQNIFDDMEITVIQYPKNFILDAINSRSVSNIEAVWKWKEQTTAGEGVAAKVTEGNIKPLIDKKFVWKYAEREKYAGRIEYTEEVQMDYESMVLDVINMFEQDVIRAWQDGVLAAIIAWAPSYTATALDGTIVKPTVYNVIGAGKLKVQLDNYEPDIVIINPADAAEAEFLQDNNGVQQFIPTALQFGGLTPFITNKIAAGTILVGTRSTVQERHSNFIMRSGQYADQLIENEYTIIGEVFSKLKLPILSKPSWVKLDVATVKAALLVEV